MPAAIILAAGLVAVPSTATAHGHGHGHKKHHGHHGYSHGYARGPYYATVPRVIAIEGSGYYNPYLVGRVYYAPHHHQHARYRFPVYVNGAVVHRAYNYCGNNLFVAGAVTLPHLAIGVQFGSPAYVPGGDPYVPVYGYGPYVEYRHHHDGDCEHDWDD